MSHAALAAACPFSEFVDIVVEKNYDRGPTSKLDIYVAASGWPM
jgi:hypothetical protein